MRKCHPWAVVATIALIIVLIQIFYLMSVTIGHLKVISQKITSIEETMSEWGLE